MDPNESSNAGTVITVELGQSTMFIGSPPAITSVNCSRSKTKRSRNGCMSCKKLKIKCDEVRPRCEYCVHRGKECVYNPPPTVVGSGRKPKKNLQKLKESSRFVKKIQKLEASKIQNKLVMNLNSMTTQFSADLFELRLFRHFLDFGGEFFTSYKNDRAYHFWNYEIPRRWGGSALVKTALLSLSSLKLLQQFELKFITHVYLQEDLSLQVFPNPRMASGINIYKLADKFFRETLQLLQQAIMDKSLQTNTETSGHIVVANIIIFAFIAVHPVSPVSLAPFQELGTSEFTIDLLDICTNFYKTAHSRYPMIQETVFESSTYPEERTVFMPKMVSGSLFHFIGYLKEYVNSHVDPTDPNKIVYNCAISTIELGCFRAYTFGYMIPAFRIVLKVGRDPDFIRLVRNKDFIAFKILFQYSALCAISGFKLFLKESIWDTYVRDFKQLSEQRFHYGLDEYDARLYDLVMKFNNGEYRFQIDMLRHVGDPTFGIMYKKDALLNQLNSAKPGFSSCAR